MPNCCGTVMPKKLGKKQNPVKKSAQARKEGSLEESYPERAKAVKDHFFHSSSLERGEAEHALSQFVQVWIEGIGRQNLK
jgi:hypothetical protein